MKSPYERARDIDRTVEKGLSDAMRAKPTTPRKGKNGPVKPALYDGAKPARTYPKRNGPTAPSRHAR